MVTETHIAPINSKLIETPHSESAAHTTHHSTAAPAESVAAPADAPKKHTTAGIRTFNLLTYGAVGMATNELLSNEVTQYYKEGKGVIAKVLDGKKGMEGYQKFVKAFDKEGLPKYAKSGRMPFVMMACVGGMFTVIPIKFMEDHKGAIVRKFDEWFHGKHKAQTDPKMIEAHEAMDKTPKQSWGSLGKGRIVTVASALGGDYVFGWREGLTAKLAKGTALERFSSLDHISDEAGHAVAKLTKNPKNFAVAQNLTWLFTLSTSLTVLFYATSKLFAKKRDVHRERAQARIEGRAPLMDETSSSAGESQSVAPAATAQVADVPSTQVASVIPMEALAPEQAVQRA